nr:TnsA-like heteromeric transposase endonuclease subunit [Parafrankia irregularis]
MEAAGSLRRERLAACWSMPFERASPVRSFGWPRGGRSFPGWWWSATLGDHVGFESWLERDHVMLLDFDPDVVALSAQPFWLRWHDGVRPRRHAPDFFVRRADGGGVVVDVRADDRIEPADAEAFAATAVACGQVGWLFRRVGVPDGVLVANVRWLARYRHPRCVGDGTLADRLVEVFAEPRSLFGGAAEVGDRIAVLPVLYHLLWCRRLVADLTGGLLGPSTAVGPAGWSR